jgi:multiple sugar transport system permease protein
MSNDAGEPIARGHPELLPPRTGRRRDQEVTRKAATISNIVLVLFAVVFVLPLLWLLSASFDSAASWAIKLPHFTFGNYRGALAGGGLDSLWNSLVLAFTAAAVSTVAAVLAAYALVRHRIPWKGPLLLMVLFMTGIPISILVIPVYQIYQNLGWLSILPSAVFLGVTSLPFEIWLLKNYIEALPVDLEEAAKMERAGTLQILRRIVLPLAFPGIAAAAIFGFVNAWGSFIVPLVLISAASQTTGPVTIFNFIAAANFQYGDIAAFSVLYSLPVLVLYVAMSRFFSGGFVLRGGVK